MCNLPRIIGLVGHPLHGKSTAQGFLSDNGILALDDAHELRVRVADEYGLTWEDVTTQEGKLQMVEAFGTVMTVRQLLGDYGQVYERKFGPHYWVDIAVNALEGDAPVSFGSLRRTQPKRIKDAGGYIIEIRDPKKPVSPHEFDKYEMAYVDATVINDGDLEHLRWSVLQAVAPYMKWGRL